MKNLKLYAWYDGDEVYDYEAVAVVFAKDESHAFELLQETDDKVFNCLKTIKPRVYESPNAFFIRGYPYTKKPQEESLDWWQEDTYARYRSL